MKGRPCLNLVRTRALLAARGLTLMDMAQAIGRSPRTIKSVLNGRQHQAPTKRAITAFLGVEIFAGIRPPRPLVAFRLQTGVEIILAELQAAKALKMLLGSSADRRERTLILTQPIIVHIPFQKTAPNETSA